jgi:putative endonuclease
MMPLPQNDRCRFELGSYVAPMLTERQKLGLQGERVAAKWLRERGWTILQQRYRNGHRDIDLIATHLDPLTRGRLVAFIEVRTRLSTDWGTPIETVQYQKQREIVQSARSWIASNKRFGDSYRFDVIGVVLVGVDAKIQYIPDAFCRN